MKKTSLMAALSIALLYWPNAAAAACSTFGGRATVVQANALGIGSVVLSDTGNLDSTGVKTASLLGAAVHGFVAVNVMHATAIAEEDYSQSEASVANLHLTVAGNIIGADFLAPRANAYCGGGGVEVSGNTEIEGLVVNGETVPVTGSPNQIVYLPDGVMIVLNEQISSVQDQDGSITVNALHVTAPGVMDTVIGSSFAAASSGALVRRPLAVIGGGSGGGGSACDFVTGGGWISNTPSGGKGTFGAGGGIHHGELWGHLEYQDHATGMNVHGTGVTAYTVGSAGPNSRHIEGTAEVNHKKGFTYMIDVADNGEPGRNDTFEIRLSNGYMARGFISGGNIQLHTNSHCCN